MSQKRRVTKPAKKSVKRTTKKKAAARPRSRADRANGKAAPVANDGGAAASRMIDQRTRELTDWRGKTLEKVRRLIKKADPEIIEEWKWVKATSPGTPVWSHNGIVCTGETYKSVVKLTFAKGASLEDPAGLFNSSLEGNVRRAIDIRETDAIDEAALADLVRAAVALNLMSPARRTRRERPRSRTSSRAK